MQNPLLELQEYENLREAVRKGQGPVQRFFQDVKDMIFIE